ncbi:MAG: hypothetical protein JWM02_1132 [Frankiales bacterium]|nr:hypothetical protein [Frankiales bacterium]
MDVTDNSGAAVGARLPRVRSAQGSLVLEGWHGVLAAGLAVFIAASVVLVTHQIDPASADTYLTSVRNAVIQFPDGSQRTAEIGARLPNGAQLRTGQQGGAELSTAGRNVYVGAVSTVDVLDGVRQTLTRGQVMVDSRKGPRLQLSTRAGTVAAKAGALARVEAAALLRLAVFEGTAAITATGRRATTAVGALHQVQVAYGYPADRVTPLALTDDAWESRLAGDLVSADQDLVHLADSLGGSDGRAVLTAAPVALRTASLGAVAASGEQAVAVAVAEVASRSAGPVTDRLAFVLSARSDGGSWGVVAALVGARVTAVSTLLDAALTPAGDSTPGTTVAGQIPNVQGLFGSSPSATTPTTTRPTEQGPGGGRPSTQPSTGPSTQPSGIPTPTTPTPPGLIGGLVNTVLGLLPHPTATPAAASTPSPSPAPLVDLNLGGLGLKLG